MKYLLLILFFLYSCDQEQLSINYNIKKRDKIFVVNGEPYKIYEGSDGHEYYLLEIGMGGQLSSDMPFHYPNCFKCYHK